MKPKCRSLAAVRALAAFGLALVVSGCVELSEDYWLNADGSGKLRFVAICRPEGVAAGQPDEESSGEVLRAMTEEPEAWAKQALRMLVDEAEGVEAWADLSFRLADGGAVVLHGTAYFPTLARLRIEAPAGVEWPLLSRIILGRGGWAVQFGAAEADGGQIDLPPSALAERVRLLKNDFTANREQADRQFAHFSLSLVVRLPTAARDVSIFACDQERKILRLHYEGRQISAALAAQTQSENWWFDLAQEAKGLEGGFLVKSVNEKLFGNRCLARAAIDDEETALFAYNQEVTEAREKWPLLTKRLGLAKDGPPTPELMPGH